MTSAALHPSLWIGTSSTSSHPQLTGDVSADVVVLGAGIAGVTTARLLADTGRRVILIEAGRVCGGVTGYTTAKVTSLQSTIYTRLVEAWGVERAASYRAANDAAIDKVRALTVLDAIDCDLEEASAFTYTESEDGIEKIEREAEAASQAGLAVSVTTDTDLPYPIRRAVRVDGQAQFHPRNYCLGLLEAFKAGGGTVFEQTRAVAIDDSGRVTTDHGVVTADTIVVATHLPISDTGGHFARTEPQRSYALAFRADRRPQGMYISIDEPTRSVRSTPDGFVIVGGEGHKVGHDDDTTRRYSTLEAWARDRFDAAAVEYRWSAQDYQSADGLPFIGRLSAGSGRTFVATGFGKWGMTNGTVAAMIITDLIQDLPNPWIETFDATRLAPKQSAKAVVRENVDVAKRFIGDRLATLSPPDVASLAPGEGAIASLDGHNVAAYRDESGELHCVSAICTHLGCQVSFNTAERSWDCPCHGSRFDTHGRVLQGPAVAPLAPQDT